MKYRITATFDIDPTEYGVNVTNGTQGDIDARVCELAEAILNSQTDWPNERNIFDRFEAGMNLQVQPLPTTDKLTRAWNKMRS